MKAIREMKNQKGFTLIEIMIVVLIIGILLAIAIPNFVKAREKSQEKSCVANLKQLEAAKEQFLMDTPASDITGPGDLCGDGKYIKVEPKCPLDTSKAYTITKTTSPACPNLPATHKLPS